MKNENNFPIDVLLLLFCGALLVLIIGANLFKVGAKEETPTETQIIKQAPIIDYTNFELAISHLKQYEGLSLTPYEMDGHTYIGYGQQVKNPPKEITEAEAEEMLKETFQYYLIYVNNRYNVYGNELLALSLLWYNVRPESIRNSRLEKELQKNRSEWDKDVIRESWLSLCNFKGRVHKKLRERRQFEVSLFFNL